MPSYEFACEACNHHFDTIRKIADRELPEGEPCPACAATGTVKRFIGNTHIEWSDAIQLGMKKAPDDWRQFLKTLKKNTRGAADNINVG